MLAQDHGVVSVEEGAARAAEAALASMAAARAAIAR